LDKDLRAQATQIHLRLRSLKGCDVLHHSLRVESVETLNPPCDIDVSSREVVARVVSSQAHAFMEKMDA
jgi:hypothetical protein